MGKMSEAQRKKCHAIIHGASAAAAGAASGMAQLPCADTAVITPIQIGMITGLGGVFGIELTKSSAKAVLASGISSQVGRAVSQWLVGWIPGVGNAVNASTAAGITEALGWSVAENFARQAGRGRA